VFFFFFFFCYNGEYHYLPGDAEPPALKERLGKQYLLLLHPLCMLEKQKKANAKSSGIVKQK